MDEETRGAIERATQRARAVLTDDFMAQLAGTFDILASGEIPAQPGPHLSARDVFAREKILAAISHKRAGNMSASEAVADFVRDSAFTTLNRFAALKLLEARQLVQECVSRGEQSNGYREFCGLAPGVALLPLGTGYKLYVECVFDELSTEVKVLFDRRDPASVLWPRRAAFEELLGILNEPELSHVWSEDETIGWIYQYFNSGDERRGLREESQAPRNSRELAIRNQFFTPKYVVRFLVDNTLGRLWHEMTGGRTAVGALLLKDEKLKSRATKDPREIRVLDPACGSGHFLLYSFDLLLSIYREAWEMEDSAAAAKLRADYSDLKALELDAPRLIVENNLYGVDIDARCAQIAALALWLRAQRAWTELNVPRANRPRIRRTHIVVAEPIAYEEEIGKRFADALSPPLLATLFNRLTRATEIAGELGVLLRTDDLLSGDIKKAREQFLAGQRGQMRLPGFRGPTSAEIEGISDDAFFDGVEESLLNALSEFASQLDHLSSRRRMFVDDAAFGLALTQTVRRRFDCVLMNPPFGLATPRGQDYINSNYRGAHNDIFAAFVRRGLLLAPDGFVGVISSRSFLVTKRLEAFRRTDILPNLRLLADLGPGVMDSAMVESAAYVLGRGAPDVFIAVDVRSNPSRLPDSIGEGKTVSKKDMQQLPLAKILYDLPAEVTKALTLSERLEPNVATAREGMKSFDNERFLRLFWEVDEHKIGSDWLRFAKGGRAKQIVGSHPLVLRYHRDGIELDQKNIAVNGTVAQVRQASTFWFRPGATYSRRAIEFAPRVLPAGYVFSDKGPAILPETSSVSPAYVLGWLNSRAIRYLVELQANAKDYLTGIVKILPWVQPDEEARHKVERVVGNALRAWLEVEAITETSPYFVGPGSGSTFETVLENRRSRRLQADATLAECLTVCNDVIDDLYDVDSSRWPILGDSSESEDHDEDDEEEETSTARDDLSLLTWALGALLGRWTTQDAHVAVPEAFSEPPKVQPAIVSGSARSGIVPDDPGLQDDILAGVARVFAVRWNREETSVANELEERIGTAEMRALFRSGANGESVWRSHVASHTVQRRVAPVLWRMGVPSGDYSLWINGGSATKDTLYDALQTYVAPKLKHEEAKLLSLRTRAADGASPKDRKAIEHQESVLEELRAFKDDITMCAALWTPHRDDGTIVNLAPLWRLFGHDPQFQRELFTVWQELMNGDHDWSQTAMDLWPDRVVKKAGKDIELAIAHGLDRELFVAYDSKWEPRTNHDEIIRRLVATKASPLRAAALARLSAFDFATRPRRSRKTRKD